MNATPAASASSSGASERSGELDGDAADAKEEQSHAPVREFFVECET